MSRATLLILMTAVGGCASSGVQPANPDAAIPASYAEAPASALAFDPPIDGGALHPELSRSLRGPRAYLGYDQPSTESFTTITDSLQSDTFGDSYVQESISVRSGARSR